MKALLLAAGFGTRLKPFTFSHAKPTLPLLGVPFIHYPLQYLRHNGVEGVVINLHAHPESVQKVAGNEYSGLPVGYSPEKEILGTAGAIANAQHLLGQGPCVVMNGDMLSDIPIARVLEQHQKNNADVTLVVSPAEHFPDYSGLYFDESMNFTGIEAGNGAKYHYCGLQIVNPKVVECIPKDRRSEVFRDIYIHHMQDFRIQGYLYNGIWLEIGNLKQYLRTSVHLSNEPLPDYLQPPGKDGLISSKANLDPDARVAASVVFDGAHIASGVTVEHSIIGWDVEVRRDVKNVAIAQGILPWYIQR